MCFSIIRNIKKEQKRALLEKELLRRIDLIRILGEPKSAFTIIDSRDMSFELVNEFLALDPKSSSISSIIPRGDKPRIRIGPENYEIRYSYGLRSGISGPELLETSRDFCIHLIEAGKLYTKAEINRMDNGFGLSVFQYAGGFYHNPDTGETTPYCRHTWKENIVIKN